MIQTEPKLVFLLSNWYSGATLFTILLNNHSHIVSNGETMLFDDADNTRYDCTCGKFIDECEFYASTAAHMRLPNAAGWDKRLFVQVPRLSNNLILRPLFNSTRFESRLRDSLISLFPTSRNARDRFLDAQMQFFTNAKKLGGASIYLDGTKSVRRAQLFARDGHCDMKILHLIRDGRGFSASYIKNAGPNTRVSDAANAWLRYISRVDSFSKAFPSVPLLTVRYEDLCRSTEETIRTTCKFLDIPFEDLTTAPPKAMHILGNRMRRNFSGAIAEDTSWKEKLDHRTQATLTALMKRQLDRLGYL